MISAGMGYGNVHQATSAPYVLSPDHAPGNIRNPISMPNGQGEDSQAYPPEILLANVLHRRESIL